MIDVEDIIARLSGSLIPADRPTFRRAAEAAVAAALLAGLDRGAEGAIYRLVEREWHRRFKPPLRVEDEVARHYRGGHSKLIDEGKPSARRRHPSIQAPSRP